MISEAVVSIDGVIVNPGSLWTQLGSRITNGLESDCLIIIPVGLATLVVGDRRQGTDSWVDLINRDFETVGGCMLEAYLEKIAEATDAKLTQYQWVVVSIQNVMEVDKVIIITGRIRPMLTGLGMPLTVPLE